MSLCNGSLGNRMTEEEFFAEMKTAFKYVPLSVEHGNWRKKFGWWLTGRREAVALRLAPWLLGSWLDSAQEHRDIAQAWREVAAANRQLQADSAEVQARGRAMLAEAGYDEEGEASG